jgi:hypothetical protein
LRLKQIADVAEGAPERVEGAGLGLAQVCLDLVIIMALRDTGPIT